MKKLRLFIKRAGQLPGLHVPIIRLWNTYEHLKFVFHANKNVYSFEDNTLIKPYRVYWISPSKIKKMSGSSFNFIKDTGRIIDGSWDKDAINIEKESIYKRFEKVFLHDVPWEETNYYNRRVQKISTGKPKRYANLSQLDSKLDTYENIYEQFKTGEYKLQSELATENRCSGLGDGGRALFPSLTDHTLMRHEIAVNVGRDGTLLRNDGRHRLALAILAGLDEVPVRIVVRHSEWQQHRDEVVRLIENGIENGISAEGIHEYVEEEYKTELKNIKMGLEHPDLYVVFKEHFKNI